MEISAEARKIEASHGGSITKKRMTPEIRATTLAIAAKTMLTVRSWCIRSLGEFTMRTLSRRSKTSVGLSLSGRGNWEQFGDLN